MSDFPLEIKDSMIECGCWEIHTPTDKNQLWILKAGSLSARPAQIPFHPARIDELLKVVFAAYERATERNLLS